MAEKYLCSLNPILLATRLWTPKRVDIDEQEGKNSAGRSGSRIEAADVGNRATKNCKNLPRSSFALRRLLLQQA